MRSKPSTLPSCKHPLSKYPAQTPTCRCAEASTASIGVQLVAIIGVGTGYLEHWRLHNGSLQGLEGTFSLGGLAPAFRGTIPFQVCCLYRGYFLRNGMPIYFVVHR